MEISVVIPVYNKIEYLETLLGQLSSQSFSDYECILIDDGSTDGSETICDEYVRLDKRFKVIHIPNRGVSHARNIGINMAQGKYITFLDSDDEIGNDYLNSLYLAISDNQTDMVISTHTKINRDGSEIAISGNPFEDKTYMIAEILPSFAKVQRNTGIFGWCWAKIVKRYLIADTRFNEELELAEDFDFYLNIYAKTGTIRFVTIKDGYYYRINANNGSMISAQDDQINYYSQLLVMLHYRSFLQEMNAWFGENESIVNELINRYVFYSLYYCKRKDLIQLFNNIVALRKKDPWPIKAFNLRSIVILLSVKRAKPYCTIFYLNAFRQIRKITGRR